MGQDVVHLEAGAVAEEALGVTEVAEVLEVAEAREGSVSAVAVVAVVEDSGEVVVVTGGHDIVFMCTSLTEASNPMNRFGTNKLSTLCTRHADAKIGTF